MKHDPRELRVSAQGPPGEERRAELRHKFFHGVAFIAETLAAKVAVKAAWVPRLVRHLMRERRVIAHRVPEGFKRRHLHMGISPTVSTTWLWISVVGFVLLYGALGTVDFILMLRYSRNQLPPARADADADAPVPAVQY